MGVKEKQQKTKLSCFIIRKPKNPGLKLVLVLRVPERMSLSCWSKMHRVCTESLNKQNQCHMI